MHLCCEHPKLPRKGAPCKLNIAFADEQAGKCFHLLYCSAFDCRKRLNKLCSLQNCRSCREVLARPGRKREQGHCHCIAKCRTQLAASPGRVTPLTLSTAERVFLLLARGAGVGTPVCSWSWFMFLAAGRASPLSTGPALMVVVAHGVVPFPIAPLLAAPVGSLMALAVDPFVRPSPLGGELACGDGALRQPPIPGLSP